MQRPPQQYRQQEIGRYRLVFGNAHVSITQGQLDHAVGARSRVGLGGGTGEQPAGQLVLVEQGPHCLGMSAQEQLEEFFKQTCRRNHRQQIRQFRNRCGCGRFQSESQFGGKAHCPQHTHRVFAVTLFRIADQAQALVADVVVAIHEIDDGAIGVTVIQRVGGEIATHGVFVQGAKHVVPQQQALVSLVRGVLVIFAHVLVRGAEGSDFDHVAAEAHMGQPETAANQAAVAELGADLFRCSAGGHIEILRVHTGEAVTDRTTHQIGFVAGIGQGIEDAQYAATDVLFREMVLATGNFATDDGGFGITLDQTFDFLDQPFWHGGGRAFLK